MSRAKFVYVCSVCDAVTRASETPTIDGKKVCQYCGSEMELGIGKEQ